MGKNTNRIRRRPFLFVFASHVNSGKNRINSSEPIVLFVSKAFFRFSSVPGSDFLSSVYRPKVARAGNTAPLEEMLHPRQSVGNNKSYLTGPRFELRFPALETNALPLDLLAGYSL